MCISNETIVDLNVEGGDEPWGDVVVFKIGPNKVNSGRASILYMVKSITGQGMFTSSSREQHLPKVQNDTRSFAMLHHAIYIFSSVRLVEAVVKKNTHPERDSRAPTGGRLLTMLLVFSENDPPYDICLEGHASTFGSSLWGKHL